MAQTLSGSLVNSGRGRQYLNWEDSGPTGYPEIIPATETTDEQPFSKSELKQLMNSHSQSQNIQAIYQEFGHTYWFYYYFKQFKSQK